LVADGAAAAAMLINLAARGRFPFLDCGARWRARWMEWPKIAVLEQKIEHNEQSIQRMVDQYLRDRQK
jgi:hypothetical protein